MAKKFTFSPTIIENIRFPVLHERLAVIWRRELCVRVFVVVQSADKARLARCCALLITNREKLVALQYCRWPSIGDLGTMIQRFHCALVFFESLLTWNLTRRNTRPKLVALAKIYSKNSSTSAFCIITRECTWCIWILKDYLVDRVLFVSDCLSSMNFCRRGAQRERFMSAYFIAVVLLRIIRSREGEAGLCGASWFDIIVSAGDI